MFRRALTVLLMLVISLQAHFAAAGVGMHGNGADLKHLTVHDDRVAHHHHEDGSVERDNSDASKQHLSQQSCPSFAVLIPSVAFPSYFSVARATAIPKPESWTEVVLDDLFRPPRTFG